MNLLSKGYGIHIVFYIKVTKDTIVNCWEKSGLIDCNETREEVEKDMGKEIFKKGLFLDLVFINWFIYFWKAYHKSFPTKHTSKHNSFSLSRYRV